MILICYVIKEEKNILMVMLIGQTILFSIIVSNSSMKKAEGPTIKKLKLEEYEIGRVLGKGKYLLM